MNPKALFALVAVSVLAPMTASPQSATPPGQEAINLKSDTVGDQTASAREEGSASATTTQNKEAGAPSGEPTEGTDRSYNMPGLDGTSGAP